MKFISRFRYSLATGNWGDQKKAHQARAGVSQVQKSDQIFLNFFKKNVSFLNKQILNFLSL